MNTSFVKCHIYYYLDEKLTLYFICGHATSYHFENIMFPADVISEIMLRYPDKVNMYQIQMYGTIQM